MSADDRLSESINKLTDERDEASAALARILGAWDEWEGRIMVANAEQRAFIEAIAAARGWVGTDTGSAS